MFGSSRNVQRGKALCDNPNSVPRRRLSCANQSYSEIFPFHRRYVGRHAMLSEKKRYMTNHFTAVKKTVTQESELHCLHPLFGSSCNVRRGKVLQDDLKATVMLESDIYCNISYLGPVFTRMRTWVSNTGQRCRMWSRVLGLLTSWCMTTYIKYITCLVAILENPASLRWDWMTSGHSRYAQIQSLILITCCCYTFLFLLNFAKIQEPNFASINFRDCKKN